MSDWKGEDRRRRELNAEDIEDLKEAVTQLAERMNDVAEELRQYAPKHEIDTEIHEQIERFRLEVDDAIGDANAASAIALGIIRRLRNDQIRRLERAKQMLIGVLAAVGSTLALAVMIASMFIEQHLHNGHLAHIEDVNNEILREAGITVDYGSSTLPLFPPPGQEGGLFGVWIYVIFGLTFLGLGAFAWWQRHCYLSNGHYDDDAEPRTVSTSIASAVCTPGDDDCDAGMCTHDDDTVTEGA